MSGTSTDGRSVGMLSPLERTLLIPLTGRAADRESPQSLLRDELAAALVHGLEGDVDSTRLGSAVALGFALRSRISDRAVAAFVRAHPGAVVVELGSGLETRMYRLGLTTEVDWYDVDLPDVIAVRKRLMPEYPPAHAIAASLLDPGWIVEIPTDRPTILVADGLFGFLTEEENRQVLRHISLTFPGGELVFSAYSSLTARLTGHYTKSVGMPADFRGFGFNDPYHVESLDPHFVFVEEETVASSPETRHLTGLTGFTTRLNARLMSWWPALARTGVWAVRYRFGDADGRDRP